MKQRHVLSVGLSVACLMAAYAYAKMNPHDQITPIFFGLGILGIMLSVLRNSGPNPPKAE